MRPRLLLAVTVAATLLPAASRRSPATRSCRSRRSSAGMHCTGYSVVRGTTISAFDVDVVDVIDSDPGDGRRADHRHGLGPGGRRHRHRPGLLGLADLLPRRQRVQRNIGAISESIGDYGGKTVLATPIELMLANSVDPPKPPTRRRPSPRAARPGTRPRPARRSAASHRKGVEAAGRPLTITGVSRALGRALERTGERIGRPVIACPPARSAASRRRRCARAPPSRPATRAATCASARSAPSPTPTTGACGRSATRSRAPARAICCSRTPTSSRSSTTRTRRSPAARTSSRSPAMTSARSPTTPPRRSSAASARCRRPPRSAPRPPTRTPAQKRFMETAVADETDVDTPDRLHAARRGRAARDRRGRRQRACAAHPAG